MSTLLDVLRFNMMTTERLMAYTPASMEEAA
jgi:hypothetical protein